VVTGEVDLERGTHGVAGDTINLASRLSNLAKPGEILIDVDTCRQVEGHFTCEYLEETTVKGKTDPVLVHKVLSQRDKPVTIHRLSGLRADLVGRKVELAELSEAVKNLQEGRGRIFSICGAAGTGKSRLVEEFKATLDFEQIQWIEGHAYAYSQNIPYFPLIDLLNRVLHIEENDPPEKVREKVESGIEYLVGKKAEVVPYVGGLYSLSYSEVEDVSPEFWKSRLQDAALTIISALAKKAPTIYYLEDLHWADPSFVELLRNAILQIRQPAIVLCVYRPTFSLFTSHQIDAISKIYHEIRLQDLSPSEAQDMLESLLKTETIPSDLRRFVQEKADGNPFYLEEMVNSLIESETLSRENGKWGVTKSIGESDISSTIHGIISGRLDRLEKEAKQILQEASVIGRAFLYEILKRITLLQNHIDKCLSGLERLDLLRTRTIQPDLEYIFKHALTHEVVYNGLLKSKRKVIHERIGLVMEQLFKDRLPEFYETLSFHFGQAKSLQKAVDYSLSFHFGQAKSLQKAVDYLIKSGEKSLRKYAVQESHQYYQQAYKLLTDKASKTKEEQEPLFDLLNKWSLVYYYRGDFKEQTDLLKRHEKEADLVVDKEKRGMFYGWLGFNLHFRGELEDSYRYLQKALELGEETENQRIIGYACTWLTWTCTVMNKYEEAYSFGKRAVEIAKYIESDQYLYFKSMAGIVHISAFSGEKKHSYEIGNQLLDYGKKQSNIRSQVAGHICIGHSYSANGDLKKAIDCYRKAIEVSADPFYSQWPRLYLGISYVLNDQIQEGEEALNEVISYGHSFGCELFIAVTKPLLGIVLINKEKMTQGLKMIEESYRFNLEMNNGYMIVLSEYILGKVYFQLAYGAGPISLSFLAKNMGFLVKNVPFAGKKAEAFFKKAIQRAKQDGAKGILGQAYLDLGHLYRAKKRDDRARECISEAVHIFGQIGAEVHLKKAKDALENMG
jgi:predicted ATPase